jgi:uncharacterized LabA/DUF88 family protein
MASDTNSRTRIRRPPRPQQINEAAQEAEIKDRRIAILIDGENSQASLLAKVIAEVSRYGTMTIRRIYGDWTTPSMNSWKEKLHHYAVQPIQQFRYTIGKNSTDSALIIDAMDILHDGVVDGFCLVASDSDYTRLATRIRETGILVIGVGESKTPKAFVNACDVFVYTENLSPTEAEQKPAADARKGASEKGSKTKGPDPVPLLREAFDVAAGEDGWASLSMMGDYLRRTDPSFDTRTYGYRQLSQIVRAYPDIFEMEHRGEAGFSSVYARLKD